MDSVLFRVATALPAFALQRRSAAMIAEKRRGATQTATQDRATLCIQQNSWYNLLTSLNEPLENAQRKTQHLSQRFQK